MFDAFISAQPAERQAQLRALIATIDGALPGGFEARMQYEMPSWSVPLSRYPKGYHCDPSQPLPFVSVGSTKRHVALYHMGLYADPELMAWFVAAWPLHASTKLDMGKSCVRFKKPETVPLDLVAALCERMSPDAWVALYEAAVRP